MNQFSKPGLTFSHVGRSISIFGFEIYFYGIVIAAAMVAGLYLPCGPRKRQGRIRTTILIWL